MTATPLDSLGSFSVDDGAIDAICWTHRGGGWEVHDWRGDKPLEQRYFSCRTKREAQRKVAQLLRTQP